ncbi:MAG TPA: ubiquinol-cytochrome c reductase iron-sulfur subunit [Thermoleophilia bacterium]|nr:ubiquinol-cytochrome c reductase iron-sulfur subunit [Thermoleophilia bacterium]
MDNEPRPPSPITRRDFLVVSLGLMGTLAAAGLLAPIVRYAFPTVHANAATRVRVASTTELTPLGKVVDFEYQETPCTLLQLEDGTYQGLSRVCTHLGCIIKWQPDDTRFFCPCHAGVFSPTGQVLAGPPPSPLPTLKLSLEGEDIWVEGWSSG